MAKPKYLLLVHEGFSSDIEELANFGEGYIRSLYKQLEKLHDHPFEAGDRFDCDGLPDLEDYLYKCDIKGPQGPKVFYFIWRDQKLVIPFYITRQLRKDIDRRYRNARVEEHTELVSVILEGWPDTAGKCELWRVIDGECAKINAGEWLGTIS